MRNIFNRLVTGSFGKTSYLKLEKRIAEITGWAVANSITKEGWLVILHEKSLYSRLFQDGSEKI